jgi:hypothetical protein
LCVCISSRRTADGGSSGWVRFSNLEVLYYTVYKYRSCQSHVNECLTTSPDINCNHHYAAADAGDLSHLATRSLIIVTGSHCFLVETRYLRGGVENPLLHFRLYVLCEARLSRASLQKPCESCRPAPQWRLQRTWKVSSKMVRWIWRGELEVLTQAGCWWLAVENAGCLEAGKPHAPQTAPFGLPTDCSLPMPFSRAVHEPGSFFSQSRIVLSSERPGPGYEYR